MNIHLSKKQQLIVFFVLAFGIGWLAFLPTMLSDTHPVWGAFVFLFSPAIAALVTAFLVDGVPGVKDVLRRYLLWRLPVKWYVLALLLLPVIFLATALVFSMGSLPFLWTNSPWYFVIASFIYLLFINSGEEVGWRGFALPRLQGEIKNSLVAGIVLGAIWGLWHLPMYLDPRQSSFPLILFLLFTIGVSIIYSVLFNNTRGSLLLVVILHASTDIAPRIMQIANFTPAAWSVVVALTWISALILYFAANKAAPIM